MGPVLLRFFLSTFMQWGLGEAACATISQCGRQKRVLAFHLHCYIVPCFTFKNENLLLEFLRILLASIVPLRLLEYFIVKMAMKGKEGNSIVMCSTLSTASSENLICVLSNWICNEMVPSFV